MWLHKGAQNSGFFCLWLPLQPPIAHPYPQVYPSSPVPTSRTRSPRPQQQSTLRSFAICCTCQPVAPEQGLGTVYPIGIQGPEPTDLGPGLTTFLIWCSPHSSLAAAAVYWVSLPSSPPVAGQQAGH